jgi:hypothetical protein
MRLFLKQLRQLLFPKGTWVAFNADFTGLAIFEEELPARRYASENLMTVEFIRFGYDVRQEILRK